VTVDFPERIVSSRLDLDPTRLVFIDETWASTNMARKRGRCRRGRRLRAAVPHGHHKTVTLVAGLRLRGLVAQKAFDRPINAASFEEWVEKCLVPTLSKGDIVVMDVARVRDRDLGALRYSAIPSSPPPSSTGCFTTPSLSRSRAPAIGCANTPTSCPRPSASSRTEPQIPFRRP
jgi:DDE superfamily endonuclease